MLHFIYTKIILALRNTTFSTQKSNLRSKNFGILLLNYIIAPE